MQWTNAISTEPSLEAAVAEVVEQAQAGLTGPPDLALVFISAAFASEASRLLPLLRQRLGADVAIMGGTGSGIIGVETDGAALEIEDEPALSLTLAQLPGVSWRCFHLSTEGLPDLDSPPDDWVALVGVPPQETPQFVLLAEPVATGLNDLLQGLDYAYPDSPKIGGLASAGPGLGRVSLFCQDERHTHGMVGIALWGNIALDAIVAQGCRPIGQPYRVAVGDRNIVVKLEDPSGSAVTGTPLEILQGIFETLSEADRQLAQRALFIGVAQSSFTQNLGQGDFLIRNLLGVDPKVGAIAIGDRIRPGQRIQFHLRDAQASAEELELLLRRYQMEQQMGDGVGSNSPVGALMFTCIGRGYELYRQRHFDARLFQKYLPLAVGGAFCNGEIGPIGNTTFLHGYTSVFGILRSQSTPANPTDTPDAP